MPRKPRKLIAGYSYHITTRCNNREFKLIRRECREVFLYAIRKAIVALRASQKSKVKSQK
ncbi:hypothetical protein ACP6PM_27975 [Dapis sp. BLCC M229]